jgi:hypothetical protein
MTITELLEQMGDVTVYKARENLLKKDKFSTGRLYDSIGYSVSGSKLSIEMENYGYWVNYGRRPGSYVPVDALNKWMTLKGIDLKYSFVINRAIKEKGIKPTYFMTNAVEFVDKQYEQLVDKYLNTVLADISF